MAGRYQFEYTEDSTYARAVRLVAAHAPAGGVVVDLGCGYGQCAEPLREKGFDHLGVDMDAEALSDLRARGFRAVQADLTDRAALDAVVGEALQGRAPAAVLMLDSLEHLPDPGVLLDAVTGWAGPETAVVTSLPNVSHTDLAIKLMSGAWDMTDVGLLDRTHLSFFTEHRMLEELSSRGWSEAGREDVIISRSEQDAPPGHPFWGPGAAVEPVLRWLRACADPNGDTYQFVRAFLRQPASTTVSSAPPLSAVIRTGRGDLETTLTCLAAQDDAAAGWDVIVAAGPADAEQARGTVNSFAEEFARRCRVVEAEDDSDGGRANAGLLASSARYVAVVDAGTLLTGRWVASLLEAAGGHPGRVLRLQGYHRFGVPGPGGGEMALTRTAPAAPGPYEAARQIVSNQLPLGTFAVPRVLCRPGAVWFPPLPAHQADWAFATMAAMAAGVADVEERAVVTSTPATSPGSPPEMGAGLAAVPLIAPPGTIESFARIRPLPPAPEPTVLAAQIDQLQQQSSDLYAEVERLRAAVTAAEVDRDNYRRLFEEIRHSEWWRATAPARLAVTAARRVRSRRGRPG